MLFALHFTIGIGIIVLIISNLLEVKVMLFGFNHKAKFLFIFVCCFVSLIASYIGIAKAQTVSQTNAAIELLEGVSVAKTTDLDFGGVILNGSGTSVVKIATNNNRTVVSGDVVLANGLGGSAADYTITGTDGETIEINADNVQVLGDGLTLENADFTTDYGTGEVLLGTGTESFPASSSGTTVKIGGAVTINEDAVPAPTEGTYTTTFDMNADYQ